MPRFPHEIVFQPRRSFGLDRPLTFPRHCHERAFGIISREPLKSVQRQIRSNKKKFLWMRGSPKNQEFALQVGIPGYVACRSDLENIGGDPPMTFIEDRCGHDRRSLYEQISAIRK